jgi:transcription factor 1
VLAGPGALTRALLNLPKERIRKLIVIEDHEQYLDYIRVSLILHLVSALIYSFCVKPLADLDPRLVVITNGGFAWDSYQLIEDSGLLDDVKVYPWDQGRTFE